ncbi:MAG TPA: molybdate ABC transporter substrate-binding protein, partial [Chromatiales bacterium]|nr:molybdate ABC transporter substrate-binding protein [Chromatiales bacterium]
MRNSLLRLAFVLALTGSGLASADTIRVAVASNFVDPLRPIAQHFEAGTGHTVILSPGSTGKLFAQIVNGAPFDAFLAADTERPARLERDGLAVPGSRFTYAVGRLMLWSPRPGYVDDQGTVLETGR